MNDSEKLKAVLERDAAYAGRFLYAVRSTGVYCRPGCASRPPKPENVLFFDNPAEAERAGFRPCRRCRPELPGEPASPAESVKAVIEAHYMDRPRLAKALEATGLSRGHLIRVFKEKYGRTPGTYANELRFEAAEARLAAGETVLDVALDLGFESVSAFYDFFAGSTGRTPGECRSGAKPLGEEKGGRYHVYESPLGHVLVATESGAVSELLLRPDWTGQPLSTPDPLADEAARQLNEYLAGRLREFSVPLKPRGTEFQRRVWKALRTIPYGRTRSYKDVAAAIGQPGASRAVGMANNRNPIIIMIPCHRVLGADGSLVGYACGLEVKRRLLELERGVNLFAF